MEKGKNIEVRCEKVRNIIGEIPSSLIRYGNMAIGIVLLCLVGIAWWFPYKQVYTGEAVLYQIDDNQITDSIQVSLLLDFEQSSFSTRQRQPVSLHSAIGNCSGYIIQISALKDTLGRQKAIGLFKANEVKKMEQQTVAFSIAHSSGTILHQMFGRLK